MIYLFCSARKHSLKIVLALVIFLCHGCGGSSSGGDQVIAGAPTKPTSQCRTLIVDKDHTDASNNNDGRYREDGGTGPWRTVQHAVDHAQPCDTIRVRAAATPYREGNNQGGIVIATSGEEGRPITVEGFPGERPVIDQQQTGVETSLIAGFVLGCVSWITVRNFEIKNVSGAGITTALTGCAANDITLENLRIHHVYGGNLVAAIRLAVVKNIVLRNNHLSDVFKLREDDTPIANANVASENISIEHNTIETINNGVTFSLNGNRSLRFVNARYNIVRNGSVGFAFENAIDGGQFQQIDLYGNLISATNEAVTARLQNTANASSTLTIHHNTIAGSNDSAITLDHVSDVSIVNNIFANAAGSFLNAGANVHLSRVDYNLYWITGEPEWNLGDTAALRTLTAFQEWKTAYSIEHVDNLTSDPDANGWFADPLFIDAAQQDYRVSPNSAAANAGSDGTTLGAHFNDETVGVQW